MDLLKIAARIAVDEPVTSVSDGGDMDKFLGHEMAIMPAKGKHGETHGRCQKCGQEMIWEDGLGLNDDGTPYEPGLGEDPGWNENHPAYVVPKDGRRPGMWQLEGGAYPGRCEA